MMFPNTGYGIFALIKIICAVFKVKSRMKSSVTRATYGGTDYFFPVFGILKGTAA